jgi:hypothetical protein
MTEPPAKSARSEQREQRERSARSPTLVVGGVILLLAIAFVVAKLRGGDPKPAPGTQPSGSSAPHTLAVNGATTASGSAPTPTLATGASPALASARAPAAPSSVLFRAKWGSGEGELGRSRPQEANPEAPMSLAVAPNGDTLVLDQVNGRIVRIGKDGRVLSVMSSPVKAPQEIAVAADGSVLVADRLVDKAVSIIGPDGKVRGALTLEGKGMSEGGAMTGLFLDGDSVYAEREHQQLVRLGSTDGKADPLRDEIPGRPSRDGTFFLNAYLQQDPRDAVFVNATTRKPEAHRFTRRLALGYEAIGILALDTDRAGIIYLAVLGSTTGDQSGATVTLFCLEPEHGAPIGQTSLPANTMPEETFRDLAVLDGGGAIYTVRTESGVELTHVDCRPAG